METFNVTVLPTPSLPIVKDTTLCEGTPDIPVTAVGSNLKWYGNNSDTSLLAEPPLIKTNATTQQHFFVSQTINGCESNKVVLTASVTSKPEINLGNDKVACEGKSLSLSTQNKPNEHYLWNTGDTSSSIVVNINGTYSCMATNVCGSNEDAISVQFVDCDNCLYVPNVFSPNDDGNNDFFQIYSNCPIINFRIKIFNSWGEKIFESERKDFKWDGNYKGYLQDAGIYTYILSLTNELGQTLFSKGSITLVR
jgi:gliding motility-associated-like protein